MSTSIWRRLFLSFAVLAGLAWMSAPANANLVLELNGTEVSNTTTNGLSFTGSQDGFNVVAVAGASNSPGGPVISLLNLSSVLIENTNTTEAVLSIVLGETDYTFPSVGDAFLASTISGNVTTGPSTLNAFIFQTWVNDSNAQNVMSPGITSGPLSTIITGVGFAAPWAPVANLVVGPVETNPFSMTTRVILTLAPGAIVNFSSSAILATVPEPSTVAMAVVGVAVVGLGGLRRLRRKKA